MINRLIDQLIVNLDISIMGIYVNLHPYLDYETDLLGSETKTSIQMNEAKQFLLFTLMGYKIT